MAEAAGVCLVLNPGDNTVTALQDLKAGESVRLRNPEETIILRDDIPYAHKFARRFIPAGAQVIKYGEVIGVAVSDIDPGAHVHVHNVTGLRARGAS
jgi:altronate dehydratase small subunit